MKSESQIDAKNYRFRFAGKLFWGLEALFGPREQLEDALAEAMKPSIAELYLLLQPFLQATPQALLQTFIVMSYKVPQERTGELEKKRRDLERAISRGKSPVSGRF